VIILLALTAMPVVPEAAPALAAAVLVFAGAAFAMRHLDREGESGDSSQKLRSPLDLVSVFQFAAFFGAVIIVGRIISDAYGQAGLLAICGDCGLGRRRRSDARYRAAWFAGDWNLRLVRTQ
jgi:uncharacterized membrane protein (DUF4010 family)